MQNLCQNVRSSKRISAYTEKYTTPYDFFTLEKLKLNAVFVNFYAKENMNWKFIAAWKIGTACNICDFTR